MFTNKTGMWLITVLIFLAFICSGANAEIYKCRNAKGQIEFKQTPCAGESLKVFNKDGEKKRTGKGGVTYIKNSISAGDNVMPIESAVAVYFKDKNKINIFFSMRKLSETEIEQLKNDKATMLMWGQASPDFDKWKKYPSADIDIYLKENKPHTPENVNKVDFKFNNLTKEPSQSNLTVNGDNVTDMFQKFDFKIDGRSSKIVIDYSDQKEVSDVNYQWTFSFNVPIILVN